ncbi:MAG: DNA translocase FtsK 4TM domain-containing protein [Pseudomonadota bacterium]
MSRKKTVKRVNNKLTNKQSSSSTPPSRVTRGIKESLLFVFVAVGIFLILSLYSYTPSDPAWSHSTSVTLQQQTQNMGGVFGSNFADVSFYLFGYMAYLIPLMFTIIGWLLYIDKNEEDLFHGWNFSLRSFGFIVAILSGCGIATMHFNLPQIAFPSGIGSGGILGQLVAQQLQTWFSFVGATLFLLTLFLVGITLFSHLSWLWLMDAIGKWVIKLITSLYQLFLSVFQSINNDNKISAENKIDEAQLKITPSSTDIKKPVAIFEPQIGVNEDSKELVKENDYDPEILVEKKTLTEKLFSLKEKVKDKWPTKTEQSTETGVDNNYEMAPSNEKIEPVFDKISRGHTATSKSPRNKSSTNKSSTSKSSTSKSSTNKSSTNKSSTNNVSTRNTSTSSGISTEALATRPEVEQASIQQKPQLKMQARTAQQETNQAIEPEQKKKPIQIQTADYAIETSNRSYDESQKQLFKHDTLDGLPALSLLDFPKPPTKFTSAEELERLSRCIEERLSDYNMTVEVVAVQQGPVITRFELQLAPGIKVSQLSNLSKDLARALLVVSIRVVEVIAGKSTVGIEIPNQHREIVSFHEVLNSAAYANSKALLPLGLGADISGQPVVADLAKMPHLLVAGTTGSGKSVGVNSMIISLLFHCNPDELRLIMVDPKMLELSIYEGIPHLLCPVVTDMMEAANALRWCVAEMERRYKLMSSLGVRNIAGYNKKVKDASEAGQPIMDPLFEPNPMMASLRPDELDTLPYIVIVIDEFADMMMIVGKKVEELIARLAQKARAAGLHLIIATQRPSVNVITGLIKANIPTRIAFQVSSKIDSRTILDQMGAEALLGNGDMLFLPPGTGMPQRVHGAFVSDDEVHAVVNDLKERGCAEYIDEILSGEGIEPIAGIPGESSENESDPLYDQAVAIVIETRRASISGIQRRLKVGYNRAARMVEDMEAAGLVSRVQSNGQREVINPSPV